MNRLNKAVLALGLLAAAACGRQIDADSFSFGGVGHPDELPPAALTGGGTVEIIRMTTQWPGGVPFGESDLFLGSTILNASDIEGFAGSRVLIASPILPGQPTGGCFRDMQASNFIDGDIAFLNAGSAVTVNVQPGGNLPLDAVLFGDGSGDTDQIFYANGFLGSAVDFDTPLSFSWPGPQDGLQFETTCPPDAQDFSECAFDSSAVLPDLKVLPAMEAPGGGDHVLVNKSPITSDPVPLDADGLLFEWEPGGAETVAVVLQFYGSESAFNLGVEVYNEAPFFQDYSNLVCATPDSDGSYFISREDIRDWYERFVMAPNFAKGLCTADENDDDSCWRGEDANANGVLDSNGQDTEDLNGNGELDPLSGLAFMIFRQNLVPFTYSSSENEKVTGVVRVVSMEHGRIDWRYGDLF